MAIIPIYIPTYISDENYRPSRVLPRLLFYNGQVECEGYWLQNELSQQFEQSTFPYFDNYNVVTGSFPTVNSKSLLFFNEESVYGQTPTASLYSEYWSTYLNLLYNPITKLINASAIIPLADYRELKQNDIVEFRGNYYHLRAINDYSLKNGECTLQLLGPILADSLNLPTNCDYGSFDVACVLNIQYLVVAGGGASGGDNAGGGGAGGLRSGSISITPGTYNVIVGGGGITYPQNGKNSLLGLASASIAIGGGAGSTNELPAGNGGSGGGGGGLGDIFQGNRGGANNDGPNQGRGGGGGALTSGSDATQSPGLFDRGGNGGSGSLWINGTRYAGGGGGSSPGSPFSSIPGGLGGPGGGGTGGNTFNNPAGTPGVDNTGGGGGGGFTSQRGGSGIVIIAYSGSVQQATGGIVSYDGTYTYHTFTSASLAATNGTGSFIY
jgi:hypothetical protein